MEGKKLFEKTWEEYDGNRDNKRNKREIKEERVEGSKIIKVHQINKSII